MYKNALRLTRGLKFTRASLLVLIVCCCAALGQAQSDKQAQRGFTLASSYALSDIENINMSNGNVMFNIPLASLPADRSGHAGANVMLHYNSKLFDPTSALVPFGSGLALRTFLGWNDNGNWRYGIGYRLEVVDRRTDGAYGYGGGPAASCPDTGAAEVIKVRMRLPDGSVRDFRPTGEYNNDYDHPGFFNVDPEGRRYYCRCTAAPGFCQPRDYIIDAFAPTYQNRTYYSSDGTFQRLVISFGPNVNGFRPRYWTLYMPDGTRVSTDPTLAPNGGNRIIDRNNNYTDILNDTSNGNPATKVVDQLGRAIIIEYGPSADYVRSTGVGGEPLVWTIQWKIIHVNKTYYTGEYTQNLNTDFRVIDRITQPAQAGGLSYSFDYNGGETNDYPNGGTVNPSVGWGEVSKVTLPSGANATYSYKRDNASNLDSWLVLQNFPTRKELHYDQEYDGTSAPAAETWTYDYAFYDKKNIAYFSTLTAPDGRTSSDLFINNEGHYDHGLTASSSLPDGTLIERFWRSNSVPSSSGGGVIEMNPYVKTELTSIRNVAGNLIKTAIKDFKYDKNGNMTRADEYDWVDFASVPRDLGGNPTGLPQTAILNAALKRTLSNSYYNPTPDAADSTTNSGNSYDRSTALLHNLLKDTEISVLAQKVTRAEFVYDDPLTTGNLTEQKNWDSAKDSYSSPLTGSNSISVSSQYNAFGSPILITDARGNQTHLAYGFIGGVADLYPTEIKTAYSTSVERTEARQYDFSTGLVTVATDVDNNVSTIISYDGLGRSVLVRAAAGLAEEKQTLTQFFDSQRRVVVRSDLDLTGDGKLTSIQHYDQLGRVRLTRQLEEFSEPAVADETVGIKVQTRYAIVNPCQPTYTPQCFSDNSAIIGSYVVTSNPYREATSVAAGASPTMGWTRAKRDFHGRTVEVQTFGGPSLPFPWGSSGTSTGTVTTAFDGLFTTVTDQANRVRRNKTDGLGRLVRVDEPSDSNNTLGSQTSPTQGTNYEYDALGNLTSVVQGSQTRSLSYTSLSRLKDATSPESGAVSYQYYENGNLKTRTDPRLLPNTSTHISAVYEYDQLNRVTSRTYNDGTPNVTYAYDASGVLYSKGKLTGVSSSVSAYSYSEYDALGSVKAASQIIDGQNYAMTYRYNIAGAMISQTYPSGRVVKTNYDNAGRIAGVKNNATGLYYAGAVSTDLTNRFQYSSVGAVQAMKLGNGLWEHTNSNSRLQVTQIGLGVSSTDSSKLKLDYTFGEVVNSVLDGTRNNGNPQSQTTTLPGVTAIVQNYAYDELNRLKSAQEVGASGWTEQFSYDPFGNRNGLTVTDNPASKLPTLAPEIDTSNNRNKVLNAQSQATGYDYDVAGNLVQEPEPGTTLKKYSYDAENHLIQAKRKQGATETFISDYKYDGDGRRLKTTVGSVTTINVYNIAGQLVAEYTDSQATSSGTSYVTSDMLGSTRAITGGDAQVRERHDYLPYGEEIPTAYSNRASVAGYGMDSLRQKFTQKERDNETGLDYFNARYYASTQGRFTSADPLMSSGTIYNPQSWNRYSYTSNNPLRFVDPTGMWDWDASAGGSDTDAELEAKRQNKSLKKKERNAAKDALKYRQRFRDALAGAIALAQSGRLNASQQAEVSRAVDSYGTERDGNKVFVAFGTQGSGTGASTDGTAADDSIVVKFGRGAKGFDLIADVAHEGSHVLDNQSLNLLHSNGGMYFDGRNGDISQYETERRAYEVTSLVAQAAGKGSYLDNSPSYQVWSSGWKAAERETKRARGIDRVLSTNPHYGISPTNPGFTLDQIKNHVP